MLRFLNANDACLWKYTFFCCSSAENSTVVPTGLTSRNLRLEKGACARAGVALWFCTYELQPRKAKAL